MSKQSDSLWWLIRFVSLFAAWYDLAMWDLRESIWSDLKGFACLMCFLGWIACAMAIWCLWFPPSSSDTGPR